MTTMVSHSGYLTVRAVKALVRQPVFLIITLMQPIIWLLLFGQLFSKVVEIPGFESTGSYLDYLTPGVVVMTALFSSGWSGMGFILDMERGVMDRLLSSPVRRGAMISGPLAYQAVTTVIQSVVIFVVGWLAGARFPGGLVGIVVTIVAAILLASALASFSNALALLLRSQESVIGVAQLLVLPLVFLSSAVMDIRVAPEWIQTVSTYNPVDWAATASRIVLSADPDWYEVLWRLGGLLAVAVVVGWLATRAFRTYQRAA